MKRVDLICYLFFFLFLIPDTVNAQCFSSGINCDEAVSINAFPYSGMLEDRNTPQEDFPDCVPDQFIDNPNWYKVDITSTTFKIKITPSQCIQQAGMHAALFSDCDLTIPSIASACTCSTDSLILDADVIVPGTYFLMLDGCVKDICNFDIELLAGVVAPDPEHTIGVLDTPAVVNFNNALSFCPGMVLNFEIPENAAAENYQWNFPPGTVPISTDCNEAVAVLGSNSGIVSVTVSNDSTSVLSPALFIDIGTFVGFDFGEYCFPDEPGWWHPGSGLFFPGGTHQINLITAEGCDSIVTIEVIEHVSIPNVLNFELCLGDSVVVAGMTFSGPTNTQINLINAFGCDSVIILDIAVITGPAFSLTATNDNCNACDGQISTDVTFGTPPYAYEWSNGMTSQDLSNLCAGTYTLTLTDANGCPTIDSVEVSGFNSNNLQLSHNTLMPLCWSGCEGRIDIQISCGTPPYTIDWSGSLPDGQTSVDGLCAGTYTIRVEDTNGDTLTQEFIINTPPEIQLSVMSLNPECSGSAAGAIDLNVTGGIAPFTFEWSNNNGGVIGTTQNLTGLTSGSYSVIVTDANGCTATGTFSLVDPNLLMAEVVSENVTCTSLGSASVMASGGTPPYLYEWSNGETGAQIVDLIDGTYFVTVTDFNNCTVTASVVIEPSIQLELSSRSADCDSLGGTAMVNVLSGSSNPEYAWSNGETTAALTNLSPGWYSVTVTDGVTGCNVHRNIEVPLDSACFVRISGYIYNDDADRNCAPDAAIGVPNQLIELSNGDFTTSNSDGYYEFKVPPSTYSLNVILNNTQYSPLCINPITVAATTIGATYPDNNFYLKESGVRNLGLKVSKQNARPGFLQRIRICVMNYGSIPMDGTLTFVHDPNQELDDTWQIPTSYDMASHTLKWDFTAHPPGFVRIYTIYMKIPVGTPLNTPLNMFFQVDPITGDIDPSDNTIDCPFIVTGSYDPNDKQVTPAGEEAEGNITLQDSILSYQIRFQNTGTDTAFTVVLRDTLDPSLDIRTLLPGPSSHPYHLDIIKGNILEFTFENIMLPDSFVNEPASNGFVFFDIQLHKGLEYGTTVSNTAAIYFDFNAPIITNTVTNTLKMPVGLFDPPKEAIQLSLLPNPNRGKGLLRYELKGKERVRIVVYDGLGRQVKLLQGFTEQAAGDYQLPLNLLEQRPGVYFIRVETAEGRGGVLRWLYLD